MIQSYKYTYSRSSFVPNFVMQNNSWILSYSFCQKTKRAWSGWIRNLILAWCILIWLPTEAAWGVMIRAGSGHDKANFSFPNNFVAVFLILTTRFMDPSQKPWRISGQVRTRYLDTSICGRFSIQILSQLRKWMPSPNRLTRSDRPTSRKSARMLVSLEKAQQNATTEDGTTVQATRRLQEAVSYSRSQLPQLRPQIVAIWKNCLPNHLVHADGARRKRVCHLHPIWVCLHCSTFCRCRVKRRQTRFILKPPMFDLWPLVSWIEVKYLWWISAEAWTWYLDAPICNCGQNKSFLDCENECLHPIVSPSRA
jgi:hypothetical protein